MAKQRLSLLIIGVLLGFGCGWATDTIRVMLNSQVVGAAIPADYSGLSYETRMMLPDAEGHYYFCRKTRNLSGCSSVLV